MKKLFRYVAPVICIAILSACATQETAPCALAPDELDQVKTNALSYLLKERPDVNAECSEISDKIVAVDPGKCAIGGGPTGAAGCAAPSYAGYSIVFDPDTLEPEDIFFKTE